MDIKKLTNKSDNIGLWSSALCIIHCSVLPVLMTLFTTYSPILGNSMNELVVDLLFFLLAFVAVYFSSRSAKNMALKVAFWVFLFCFGLGIFLSYLSFSQYIILLGSCGLIISHFLNLKVFRKTAKA